MDLNPIGPPTDLLYSFNYSSAIGLNAALTRYSKGDLVRLTLFSYIFCCWMHTTPNSLVLTPTGQSFVVTATNSNVTQGKQFPLASHATVFAYNIPALNSQEPNLVGLLCSSIDC